MARQAFILFEAIVGEAGNVASDGSGAVFFFAGADTVAIHYMLQLLVLCTPSCWARHSLHVGFPRRWWCSHWLLVSATCSFMSWGPSAQVAFRVQVHRFEHHGHVADD